MDKIDNLITFLRVPAKLRFLTWKGRRRLEVDPCIKKVDTMVCKATSMKPKVKENIKK
jgi:hypothetical protein